MHFGLKSLAQFFAAHCGEDHLVLAIVTATEGSTYRKPGALMLMGAEGEFAGLISGGCLEGDLVKRAMQVLDTGAAMRVSYDLHDDEELIWGLGLGCGGDVHLLLRRLDRAKNFAGLGRLFKTLDAGEPCSLALVTESHSSRWPLGAMAVLGGESPAWGDASMAQWLDRKPLNPVSVAGRTRRHEIATGASSTQVLITDIPPTPRVLICGGGPDAVPMAAQVVALGWHCTVMDHRPAFSRAERFPPGVRVVCARPEKLPEVVPLEQVDAALVMSHHVEHDAAYLSALIKSPPSYLGLLGPTARREQILQTIGAPGVPVRGPAGLDIGAELPEAIALSIMAEIHACLNHREGQGLTRV